MGNNNIYFPTNLIFSLILICCVSSTLSQGKGNAPLSIGFYRKSCPEAERIVKNVVTKAVLDDSGMAASLIRLFFHDCFVKGCDASILLDKTPSGKEIERKSPGNIGIRGLEVIDEIKSQLEKTCPNTVSCADIISFAARDSVAISAVAPYEVPAGRRDGVESLESNVFNNLPFPNSNVSQMTDIFTKKGLDKSDLVTLLGVHSIGVAHCSLFAQQIHHFNATHDSNPKLNEKYIATLRRICPDPNSSKSKSKSKSNENSVLPLNLLKGVGNKLSTMFYNNVVWGRVVIPADQSLLDDEFTRRMVRRYITEPINWANDFRQAMVKMGNVEVLTGKQGQIRKNCRAVNK